VSVIHKLVYPIIHEHVCLRKTETEMAGEGINGRRCQLSKESDDTLYRYCGAALQRMIKLWKETCQKKRTGRFVKTAETGYGAGVGNFTATRYER